MYNYIMYIYIYIYDSIDIHMCVCANVYNVYHIYQYTQIDNIMGDQLLHVPASILTRTLPNAGIGI